MHRRILILLLICFTISRLYAQSPTVKEQESYTHEFTAKVYSIDTVNVINPKYQLERKRDDKVAIVNIKILSRLKGDFGHIPDYIMIELSISDHLLRYDFVVGRSYKVFAYLAAYNSPFILKKYRRAALRLDRFNLPIMIR